MPKSETEVEFPHAVINAQHEHWNQTFVSKPEMFGLDPSKPAIEAARQFEHEGRRKILELGSGQGRDTLFFAGRGFTSPLPITRWLPLTRSHRRRTRQG